MNRKENSCGRGFSLIEMLVALSIASLVGSAGYYFFILQEKAFSVHDQVTDMQQNARMGLDVMLRELRMAGYDPTNTANAGVVEATAEKIRVTMDLNGDGDVADADEDVAYSLADMDGDGDLDLRRTVAGVDQLVAENFSELSLTYIVNGSGATSAPADLTKIRGVSASVTSHTSKPDKDYPENNGHRTWSMKMKVHMSNMEL